jgi:hypothetical protein
VLFFPWHILYDKPSGGNSDNGSSSGKNPVGTESEGTESDDPDSEDPDSDDPGTDGMSLSPYFPTDRITLPKGSKIIDITNDFDIDEDGYTNTENTWLDLSMTKTEAIEWFTPMLDSGNVRQFVDSGDMDDNFPWEVTGRFDDIANYVELYASYESDTNTADIYIIRVQLFTLKDLETIVVARIVVQYEKNPTTN